MFFWLGRFTYAYRRIILIASVLFVGFAATWGFGLFGAMSGGSLTPPDSDAQRTADILEEHFGHPPGVVDTVAVFTDPSGTLTADDPEFEAEARAALERLPESEVSAVTSYWSPGLTEEERARYVADDDSAAIAVLTLRGANDEERRQTYAEIEGLVRTDGALETYLAGGSTSRFHLEAQAQQSLATSQMIAMPILLVLLLLVFRGLIAALVPLGVGLVAIFGSLAMLRGLTYATEISIYAVEITVLLGLGLAIDYGLFMVTRFRRELEAHEGDVREALVRTMRTSGRTVAFSGLVVVVGLCGLLFFPQQMSHSLGWGGITVVLVDLLAALVLLPAALAALGPRINAVSPRWLRRRPGVVTREDRGWARLSDSITRRPVPYLVAGLAVLVAAAAPLLALQPGATNHRYLPQDNEGQVVPRILAEDFGVDNAAQSHFDIAITGGADERAVADYLDSVAAVEHAHNPTVFASDEEMTWITVSTTGEVDDPHNLQLVRDIRALPAPAGAEEVLVGGDGSSAMSVDNTEATTAALPWALAFVGVTTLILLTIAFRSVLVPLKAVLVAFGSLAASLGLVVWGFQQGAFAGVLDFYVVGTTDVWTLAIIITIAFGLVTDYEMFLVHRVYEEYQDTGDNARSIRTGLRETGSVITRAGLLMITVLASMGFSATSQFIMIIGIGLTLCVLIDATVVRSILVPATMRLLGRANWWPGTSPRPRRH